MSSRMSIAELRAQAKAARKAPTAGAINLECEVTGKTLDGVAIQDGRVDLAHVCIGLGLLQNVDDTRFEKQSSSEARGGGLVFNGDFVDGETYHVFGTPDASLMPTTAASCHRGAIRSVALGYHDCMLAHAPENPRIVEAPMRLRRTVGAVVDSPLIRQHIQRRVRKDDCEEEDDLLFSINPRPATDEEILRVHSQSRYANFLAGKGPLTDLPSDVYCTESNASLEAARMAAGITIEGAKLVHAKKVEHCFCLVRPPGHHCSHAAPSGFCLLNNVVIAIRELQHQCQQSGAPSPRIAIVDIDVHHGEGTQELIEEDPNIAFFSTHRYDEGQFYPKTGHPTSKGKNGQCVNIGFNTEPNNLHEGGARTMSDSCLDAAVDTIINPALKNFKPSLIFVSCGFDAAHGDPLGGMSVVNGFGRAIAKLKDGNPDTGLVCVLEGGYHPDRVAEGTLQVIESLLLDRREEDLPPSMVPPQWAVVRRKIAALPPKGQQANKEVQGGADLDADDDAQESPQPQDDESLMIAHRCWLAATMAVVKEVHERSPMFQFVA